MNARLARNDGFTTVAIMITLMLSSLLVFAAYTTANSGIPLARGDQNAKQAYSAAEAGIAFYSYHLAQDPNYWTFCANPPKPASPNPLWNGNANTARLWREIPAPTGSPDKGPPASYNILLVHAPGAVQCEDGLAASTYLNQQNGTFTIVSTGQYRGKYRSIVASYRRVGFVNFLWFTDYETPDALAYPLNQQAGVLKNCSGTYRRDGRDLSDCSDQQFIDADTMAGPMHTNDRFYTCGGPVFGLTANDRIEASDPKEFEFGCGTAQPKGAGTKIAGAPIMTFPPSNTDLAGDTLPGWTFTGKTHLTFQSNGTLKVTNGGVTQQLGMPPNNVIYIKNGACNKPYQEAQHYDAPVGCGDAWIDGTYKDSMTIGADNDIIVDGDLLRADQTSANEMGLIANGFVRVYHPIKWLPGETECSASDASASDALFNVTIDAAILSLQHSFLVDNARCGDPEGTLTVDGAIAQKYRGTVGTHSNGTVINTGYAKNYKYDQSLRYADPPYFLDPVETSWNVVRETEQVPALKP